jgi:nitrite reductase/ring-hydroxylating ferredoxin subunit
VSEFVRVAALSEIPPGRMLAVRAGGEEIALYNVEGSIHATRDSCTHQQYPLSKGALRGRTVKCALHGWEYDVTTGEYQGNPAVHVRCFPVKVEGDGVWVSLEPLKSPERPFVSRDDA